jgi:hypothetical protein
MEEKDPPCYYDAIRQRPTEVVKMSCLKVKGIGLPDPPDEVGSVPTGVKLMVSCSDRGVCTDRISLLRRVFALEALVKELIALLMLRSAPKADAFNMSSVNDESFDDIVPFFGVLCIVFGFGFLVFGEKYPRGMLFVLSILIGIVVTRSLCETIGYQGMEAVGIGALLGLLLGFLIVKSWKVMIFLVGGLFGFGLWFCLHSSLSIAGSKALVYGTLVVVCVVFGVISMYFEKLWITIAMPVIGTALTLQGFREYFNTPFNIPDMIRGETSCRFDECANAYLLLLFVLITGYSSQFIVRNHCKLDVKKRLRKSAGDFGRRLQVPEGKKEDLLTG